MPIRTRCLFCDRVLHDHLSFAQYLFHDELCSTCRRLLKIKRQCVQIHHLKVTAFYEYDDVFSDFLIQYKECMDEALRDVFLSEVKDWVYWHYRHCVFLCAPSSAQALQKRGFHHVKQMFEQCGIMIVDCFEKTADVHQKAGSFAERRNIEENLIVHKELIPSGKRLVLVDDTATTGSTLLAMQKLIGKDRVKEALCVAVHPKLISDFDKTRTRRCIYLK